MPRAIITVLFLGFLSPSAVSAPDAARSPGGARQALEAILAGNGEQSPQLSGLQVAVIKKGELVFSDALGIAHLRPDGQPVRLTTKHKIRVASISKLVTALAVMRLVEEKAIGLDDDASTYLPMTLRNPTFPETPITIAQLLSHTSSVRDGNQYWLPLGRRLSDFFPGDSSPPVGEVHYTRAPGERPGHWFTYSNLNFGLLAGVIETASGQRFDRFMRRSLLGPLGLTAGFSACDITRVDPDLLASPFRRNDASGNWDKTLPWRAQVDGDPVTCFVGMDPKPRAEAAPLAEPLLRDYQLASNPTLFSPQGGLRASAEDLAVILKLLITGGEANGERLLAAETVRSMLVPRWTYDAKNRNGVTTEGVSLEDSFAGLMTHYGLSVHIADLKAWGLSDTPRKVYGHLGDAYGLLGQAWFDPKTGDGFVALITGTGDDPKGYPGQTSPLFEPEEQLMRWWLAHF